MKGSILVLGALLLALCAALFASRGHSQSLVQADDVYRSYDAQFRAHLAAAVEQVGKPTILVERCSDRYTVPQKLTIQGSPRDIGLTIGHVARAAGARLPKLADAHRHMNQRLVELYQRIYPEYLELVAGIGQAYQRPLADIDLRLLESDFATRLWCDLLQYNRFYRATDFRKQGEPFRGEHCSAASYFIDGRHLVGRNFDHASDRPHFFVSLAMDGCYKVLGNTIYDVTGEVDDGMNERGLALCVASNNDGRYATREPYPDEPAIVMWHMMQIVLQKCATVDEAVALIQGVRVWFPEENNHWLLADATGRSVVVEWRPGTLEPVIFDKPGPYELMTNTAAQEGEPHLLANCRRYGKAHPLLEAGVHNPADMLEVMEAMRITAGPGRSLWTSVMDLNARTFEVRYFKEYDRAHKFGF